MKNGTFALALKQRIREKKIITDNAFCSDSV